MGVHAVIAAMDMLARAGSGCVFHPVTVPAETMGVVVSAAPVKMTWRAPLKDVFAHQIAKEKAAETMDVKAPAETVKPASTALKTPAYAKGAAKERSVEMMDAVPPAETAPPMKYAAQRVKVASACPIVPKASVETMGVAESAAVVLLPGIAMRARAYVSPSAVMPFVETMAVGAPAASVL